MIYVRPGESFEATFEGPTGLSVLGRRIMDGQGATTVARATTGIVETPAGSGVYVGTQTAPSTGGQYVLVWDTGGATPLFASEELVVTTTPTVPPAALAVLGDVEARLGRELTVAEEIQVTYLLATTTDVFNAVADTDVTAVVPIPGLLRRLAVEVVIRAMAVNTSGVASEALGAHSVTYSKDTGDGGVFLTKAEEMAVRNAVYGTLSGSSTPRALPDRLIDLAENRDVDEVEA